jgi:8-oxo-dGTP diphosphatase
MSQLWESNVLAGAATVHDGFFLMLRRSYRESFLPNVWGIPAGQVQRGEDPDVACLRELKEETGLRGQIVRLIGFSTFPSKRGSVELNNVQLNFLVDVPDVDVKLNRASHSEFKWISLDDTNSEFLDGFTRKIMLSARRGYEETGAGRLTRK